MPWAKVDTATGLVTNIFATHPDLDIEELDNTTVVEVGGDVVIGNTIEIEAEAPPHHEVRAAKPAKPEQQ